MNFILPVQLFEQLKRWFGNQNQPTTPAPQSELQTLIDTGLRARYLEKFDEAEEYFRQAEVIATELKESTLVADIRLHLVDLWIDQKRYDEAQALLDERITEWRTVRHLAPLAYGLCNLGIIAQSRGNWVEARNYYEDAQRSAREAGTQGALGRATGHLAETYLHDHNASYTIHLMREALPMLESSGDTELSASFMAILAEALIISGHEMEGDALLLRAMQTAHLTKQRSTIRRMSGLLGERALQTGQYQRAQRYLAEAIGLYTEPITDTRTYAQLLCNQSSVLLKLGEAEQAIEAGRTALEWAERSQVSSLIAQANAAIGLAMRRSGARTEAMPYLQAAVDSFQDTNIDAAMIDILRNIAATSLESGDHDAALEHYQQALNAATKGGFDLSAAQVYRDLGQFYIGARQATDALDMWQKALKIYDAEARHVTVARLYCDIAQVRSEIGQGRRAVKDIEQALIRLNNIDDHATRGYVLASAAMAYSDQGDVDSADAFFTEAIQLARQSQDKQAEAIRRGNYGRFLALTNRPRRAIAEIMQAQSSSESLGLTLQHAIYTANLGLAHLALGAPEQALNYYDEAIAKLTELNETRWLHEIQAQRAQVLIAQDKDEAALAALTTVHEALRDEDAGTTILQTLLGLAQLAIRREDTQAAQSCLQEAAELASKLNIRRDLAEVKHLQSRYLALTGDQEGAAKMWQEADKLMTMLKMPPLEPEWLEEQYKPARPAKQESPEKD